MVVECEEDTRKVFQQYHSGEVGVSPWECNIMYSTTPAVDKCHRTLLLGLGKILSPTESRNSAEEFGNLDTLLILNLNDGPWTIWIDYNWSKISGQTLYQKPYNSHISFTRQLASKKKHWAAAHTKRTVLNGIGPNNTMYFLDRLPLWSLT